MATVMLLNLDTMTNQQIDSSSLPVGAVATGRIIPAANGHPQMAEYIVGEAKRIQSFKKLFHLK